VGGSTAGFGDVESDHLQKQATVWWHSTPPKNNCDEEM
jgi:hypothetical protein